MSSNDQNPNDATTQPTLGTVLERINAVADGIAQLRTDVDQRFDVVDQQFKDAEQRVTAVGNEVANLRKDVEQGFRRVERKIDLLNRDFLSIRGDQEDVLSRIESLESKAS
ncbi:MAG: hypothetical protein V7641_4584 [Blastocatellia bacterium]